MDNLNFYKININYMKYISSFDKKVAKTYDEKSKRPYIGIILKINSFNFFAPFTSPKPKHIKMKNSIDFFKIANGKLGAINFNNMIPIPLSECIKIDILKEKSDMYKNLLFNQIAWCNKKSNTETILKKSENLYFKIINKNANENLLNRCCDFEFLQIKCSEYIPTKK